MRKIAGYVCIVLLKDAGGRSRELLYGKNVGQGTGVFQNFGTNNLTPFKFRRQAEAAERELSATSWLGDHKTSLARIRMETDEDWEETESFRRRRSTIVIRKVTGCKPIEFLLIGEFVEDRSRYPLCGSLLESNGMEPFTHFKNVQWTAQEEGRQGGPHVFLATFHLKRL